MLILYHGTGSRNFELIDEGLPGDTQEALYVNIRGILKTRGYAKALEFFESIPFSIWNGTNDFNDEFSLFYAEIPLLQYEAVKSVANYPDVKQAFTQLAEVATEIGPYIRFIAINLLHTKSDEWDVFICHAGTDKEEVARPLAKILESFGLRVWLDENELKLGDSLRKTIDHALSKSKYGIGILSKAFLDRDWPQREVNAFASLETPEGKVILPVWHEIDQGNISKYSPMLADKLAVRTSDGLTKVAFQVLEAIQPSVGYIHRKKINAENQPDTSSSERTESIKGIILAETIAIKEKAQRYLDGKSSIDELSASTPMLTSIASELRYLTPEQVIAYRRAVTLDMEMRKTGNEDKAREAIEACDEIIRLLHELKRKLKPK